MENVAEQIERKRKMKFEAFELEVLVEEANKSSLSYRKEILINPEEMEYGRLSMRKLDRKSVV